MRINGNLNEQQFNALQEALKGKQLTPEKRRTFLMRMAKHGVITATKRNIKNQQTPDGEKWAPRKSKYRPKMLRNMAKVMHIKELPKKDAVRIYFQGGKHHSNNKSIPAGTIAAIQQRGMKATINKREVEAENQKNQDKEATKRQAKKLRDLGYKIKSGKRWKKPTISDITNNMTMAQAGAIIRNMQKSEPKQSWAVEVPSRVFLGMSDEDFKKALTRTLQGIGYGELPPNKIKK